MQLQIEYLPATGTPRQELVLLHGWGSNRDIWRPVLSALRPWANITLLDIPGVAPGYGDVLPGLESVLEAIVDAAPERATYVGWSLGGQLAIEIASRWPGRTQALVALCSNPRFAATGEWPGMSPADLEAFCSAAARSPGQALRRFDSLQTQGCEQPRSVQRSLKALRPLEPGRALGAGLAWLAELDQREACRRLGVPQLHLLGERDGLLPQGLAGQLQHLLGEVPGAEVTLLPDVGHPAPLESGVEIALQCLDFLTRHGLLNDVEYLPPNLEKGDVAESFSRAATQYDSVAQLQRDVGTELLGELGALEADPLNVLDLGSGTGYFYPELQSRFPAANYTGLDLAEGMATYARSRHPSAGAWLVGDAESLPLAAGSMDLVFSSLAVQWCYRPRLLFAELARVLRPGGRCVFTSLGPDTLKELRGAWAAVDEHQHVNSFLPGAELQRAADSVPGVELTLRSQPYRMEYRQVRELLNELKTLGAHNVNRNRPSGLTGRRALQGMLRAYEQYRQDDILPATYEVYFGVLEKQ